MTLPILARDTYDMILYAWIAVGLITFVSLFRVTAPYGRHTTASWGPMINNKLGWVIMELPVLVIVALLAWWSAERQTTVTWIMIGLFCFHYINRIFIFPLRLRTKGKKMPLIIVSSAILFNLMNGFGLGYYFYAYAEYGSDWATDPRFILGLAIFIMGMVINWKADDILIHLRKPNETHYVIPRHILFSKISCPNLAGELLEWLGYAILCWNLPAWTFFIWTAANLIPRAVSHHKWYKQKFSDYPSERKAIVPYFL